MLHYNYYVSTKEGFTFHFYASDNKDIEETLKGKSSFHDSNFWILDACGNEEVLKFYEKDKEDNSFVRVPKSSVKRFFAVDGVQPRRIRSTDNFLKYFKNKATI